jgi:hypothetical protein
MDIDTSRSMSSEAAKYLRHAKKCAEAAERTTDPEIREMLLRLVADLTAAVAANPLISFMPPTPDAPCVFYVTPRAVLVLHVEPPAGLFRQPVQDNR